MKIEEAQARGREYAAKAESKWTLSEVDNPMTDDRDYTAFSTQPNGKGAVANVEATCRRPGEVMFVATLGQTPDADSALGLPDYSGGYIAGNKRINDDPPFATRFPTVKFRNSITLMTLTSGKNAREPLETTWRLLAEIETARGRLIIRIPTFDGNVQKLITACAKQYENAIKRGGVPDAPLTR